jgi:hypothetical protein
MSLDILEVFMRSNPLFMLVRTSASIQITLVLLRVCNLLQVIADLTNLIYPAAFEVLEILERLQDLHQILLSMTVL